MFGFRELAVIAVAVGVQATAPTVDLGYAVHRATVNDTGYGYYNFTNIRFGAPPTGHNRFSSPLPPKGINRTVNDGQQSVICPQSQPLWELTAAQFLPAYLTGVPIANITAALEKAGSPTAGKSPAELLKLIPAPDPRTSEDCLFLDVVVPKSIYAAKAKRSSGAAVIVWIYGGGFTSGTKGSGNPASLLARSQNNGDKGVIYVSINYRLGLFGWLSGPTFQENGTANAGLYDQRLALLWVQKYIHLFGGDPKRVTVMGESAGGSSILHQITAFGGLAGRAPFSKAITQSPGFAPVPSNHEQELFYQETLNIASLISGKSVTSTADLRALNTTALYLINFAVVALSAYGSFTFGPVVDGLFAPKLPGELLARGQFDKNLTIMVGHNSNEGLLFTDPSIQNDTAFVDYFRTFAPSATDDVVSYVTSVLYPPVFNGSYGYTDYVGRVSTLISEVSFTCNTRYLDKAYKNATYSYYFTVPPGLHGEDVQYTFFNGDTSTSDNGLPVQSAVAGALQEYLTSFAQDGNPNEDGAPYFPIYGTNSSTEVVGISGLGTQVTDTTANFRCDWWQKALYY